MDALMTGLAVVLLLGVGAILTRLPGAELGERILVYEIASLMLVATLLLVGDVAGFGAARYIALLFLALSVIGGYALVLLYWMVTDEDGGRDGDR